jgi:PKD repeat protein
MILWGGASGANYLSPGTVSGDGGIYTPGAGAFSCLASAVPSQGAAPFSSAFTATVFPSSCAGTPVFDWSFGDGATSALQNPSHLYAAPGVYSWSVLATSGGLSAGDSGTVTVCDLQCSALVPSVGQVGAPVAFSGQGAELGGCNDAMTYLWSFGDGTTSAGPSATHAYAAPGPYAWALSVSAGGGSCSSSGTIAVATPPIVSALRKGGSPFHIVASGSGFQPGIQLFINGGPWPKVALKSSGKLKISGGKDLKAAVPRGVPTAFRFVNPDGGEASVTWNW